jgi:hypothetical protein
MYTLEAIDSFRIVDPADTYIYDIVPVSAGIAAIASDDGLRFLNPQSLNGPPLNHFRGINADITCLKALKLPSGDAVVCTAGRDGKICVVDPRSNETFGELRTGEFISA